MKYTKELLEKVVKESFSYDEVLEKFISKINRGTKYKLKRKIKLFNLDTSHFIKPKRNITSLYNIKLTSTDIDNRIIKMKKPVKRIGELNDINSLSTKIEWECLIYGCNCKWFAIPRNILYKNTKCPRCSNNERITNKSIDDSIINRNMLRLDNIVNNNTKIKWKCLICEYIWKTTPATIINMSGCPKCAGNAQLTNEIVDHRLIGRNILRKGDVSNSLTSISWECLICKNIWNTSTNSILNNKTGCPKCNISKGELEIDNYLKESGITYIWQHKFDNCKNLRYLYFDFYIPTHNICIEFQGRQHYEKIYKMKNKHFTEEEAIENLKSNISRDLIKTNYCKDNNIILITIHYRDLKCIKQILDGYLQ